MHEPPADALRKKKDSSMRVAINLVKDEVAQACVSAGNTGALMAISRFVLKTLPGIDRPAIAAQLPTRDGVVTVLDLGANVNCSPEQLVQFAVMGTALVSAMDGIERPSVGLLNVGEEEIKGNELAKQTAELLRASGLNFYGNVEGNDIFKGTTEVIICDGFVGNVVLKASEGLVTMLYGILKAEFTRNPFTRLVALIAYSRAARVQAPHRSAPAQRGNAHRPQGRGRQEPRLRRCARVPARSAQGVHGSRARHARQDRPDGWPRCPRWRPAQAAAEATRRRCIAASPGPAAICPRTSSPTTSSRSASTRAMRGSGRAPAYASGGSPRPTRRPATSRSHAARAALAAAGIAPEDVDLIVVATTTPDMVFPSTACILQAKLGAVGGPAFDVQAVCSGFVYALAIADRMVAAGMARNALVVGAEIYSRILDWNDRGSCVLFGDGAGAVVLVPSPVAGHRLGASARGRALSRHPLRSGHALRGRGERHAVRADGWPGGVQVRGRRDGRGRRRGAQGQRRRRERRRLAHSAPGEYPDHGCVREEARRAFRADGRHRRPACQHVGRVDPAGARRGGARRPHQGRPSRCC